MNELRVVNKQEVLGREFTVYGDFENPLFLAKDVAEWIEYTGRTGQLLNTVDEEEKLTHTLYASGQNREMWFVTEDGLYEVLMQSTKPIARQFKKEVKKILKALRTGTHSLASNYDIAMKEVALVNEIAKVLNLNENSKLVCLNNALENHGIPTNILPQYTESKDQLLSATELLKRNEIGISVLKFNKIMLDHGYLEEKERNSSKGMKKFKSLTSSEYGENQVSPKNAHETQPLYYASKFVGLCNKLNIV